MEYGIQQVLPWLDRDEIDRVAGTIEAKWLTEGPCCREFLERLKGITGSGYAVFAPNGTLGLFLALLALDLPRGSEIIIPSFTFYASASSAVFAGLRPVFADVDPDTYNLDPDGIERLITPRTKAIMPVHVYGHACDMDRVMAIARAHDLRVVEDAAQAFGVRFRGTHAGTFGDVGVISFFADKTITTGEGAVVLTQDEGLHKRLLLLRNQGRPNSGTFLHPALGMNFRITDMQAAVGLSQLGKFEEIRRRKAENHERYRSRLGDAGDLRFMKVQPGSDFVPFRFCVRTEAKDRLQAALEAAGVQTRSFFYPMHLQPMLREYAAGPLPVAERLYETGTCLPIHPFLTEGDIDRIAETIRGVFRA